MLARHGKGHTGCDICKPAVGNILASCWNQPIMDRRWCRCRTPTTPSWPICRKTAPTRWCRVFRGEITPDKLIVIGQVAKKYDLYTKITGGQRIDLFGAQLHELPLIWGS